MQKFSEVSQLFKYSKNPVRCDFYTPYELDKIKVKQEDSSILPGVEIRIFWIAC